MNFDRMVLLMFIVGIDIAKRTHVARIIDSEGRTVAKPFSFRNSCSGYNALLARMGRITNQKSQFILAMEATSHYWLALYTRLYRAVLLNPIQTHAVREMLNNGDTKTDEIDTLAIAETIRFGRYKPSRVPQEKLLALRELCRNRYYLLWRGAVIEPVPPQLGLDPGNHLQGIEGLCDVVVGPDGQAHDLIPVQPPGCEHDNGAIGLLPDLLAELKTVRIGEHHVQKRQIQVCVLNTVQGLRAGVALVDRAAVIGEVKLQHVGQFLFIVYH